MTKKLIYIAFFLLSPACSWAACSGSSPNLTAASASQSDIAGRYLIIGKAFGGSDAASFEIGYLTMNQL